MGIVATIKGTRRAYLLSAGAIAGLCLLAVFGLRTDTLPLVPGMIGILFFIGFAFQSPQKAIIIIIAASIFMPIDLALKAPGFPRLGPTRILISAFLLGYILGKKYGLPKDGKIRRNPLRIPIAAFLALAFFSSLFSIDVNKSVFSLVSFVFEEFVLFYILCAYLREPAFWKMLKQALFLFTLLVCALAIVEEFTQFNPLISLYPQEGPLFRGELLRVRSTFFHPIALGCFLTLIAPFAIVEIIERKRKLASIFLFTLIGITLFLTVSRGPWLGFVIEITGFLLWYVRKNRYLGVAIGIFALVIIIGAGGAYVFTGADNSAIGKIINPSGVNIGNMDEKSSEYYRIALLKAVLNQLSGYRWFIGYGPGTFHLANVESKYAGDEHTLTAADSHYIKIFFEHGMLGLGIFLMILVVSMTVAWKAIKATEKCEILAVASLLAIIAFVFENITVSMFSLLPLVLIFYMIVALSINLGRTPIHYENP